jgi:hypothetical protein
MMSHANDGRGSASPGRTSYDGRAADTRPGSIPFVPSEGPSLPSGGPGVPFERPTLASDPVVRPPAVPAANAPLADDDVVVGVVAGGKARAYRLDAFRSTARHVVNDVLNKTAVSVTYCDRDDCLRVFTADREDPLPIGVGGFRHGLMLRVGADYYWQKDGKAVGGAEIPYRSLPSERTSWGQWKKAHPGTDVYVGK